MRNVELDDTLGVQTPDSVESDREPTARAGARHPQLPAVAYCVPRRCRPCPMVSYVRQEYLQIK